MNVQYRLHTPSISPSKITPQVAVELWRILTYSSTVLPKLRCGDLKGVPCKSDLILISFSLEEENISLYIFILKSSIGQMEWAPLL